MESPVIFFILTLLVNSANLCLGNKDSFVRIMEKMANVTDCTSMYKNQLLLDYGTVSQIPKYPTLNEIRHSNRSALKHMHNMAFNRALFYSFIMQTLDATYSFMYLPDWAYMSTSTTADIHANEGIFNTSAIFYDQNMHYPNWILNVDFNQTIPLFGSKAYRNESKSGVVMDMGSGYNRNYTTPGYKMNPWYELWLPDQSYHTHSMKHSVKIKYSTDTGTFLKDGFQETHFYGPRIPNQADTFERLPVKFTQPYFDCGSTNKWIVSAVSPIVDYLPRYSRYQYLRKHRYVGVAVMDMDFEQIDFNPCPVSYGNEMPNDFAGIDKCDKTTTECQPLSGYGFHRHGYTCGCRSGYHYPPSVQGPYNGTFVESHLAESRCVPTENMLDKNRQTLNDTSTSSRKRRSALHVSNIIRSLFETNVDTRLRSKRSSNFNKSSYLNAKNMFNKVSSIDGASCSGYIKDDLVLPSEYSYGLSKTFDNQARFALRLAHFLSNHHQNVVPNAKTLNIFTSHGIYYFSIFGEVIANVMADNYVLSSGVFYEPNQFVNEDRTTRQYFGPLAYIRNGEYYAIDMAGFQTRYTEADWYKAVSSRWRSRAVGLKKYKMESFMRADKNGNYTIKDPNSPIEYYAPSVEQGVWSSPYFRCDGQVDEWVVTYSVPFFGPIVANYGLIFKGVVTVDVPLKEMDVNQCPQQSPSTVNGFDNTALCDQETTDCIPLAGRAYRAGGYRCVCKKGYEYPWNDGQSWYDGMEMETQYEMKMSGNSSSVFDKLKCRRIPVPADQGPQVTTKGPVGVATSMSPIPAVVLIAACLLNAKIIIMR